MIFTGCSRTRLLLPALTAALSLLLCVLWLVFPAHRLQSLLPSQTQTALPGGDNTTGPRPSIGPAPARETEIKPWPGAPPRAVCMGPRGLDLDGGDNDDGLRESVIANLGMFYS